MTVDEARKALEQLGYEEWQGYEEVMRRADAYALAAHVEACIRDDTDGAGEWARRCGDGWYCENAKRIEEL